MLIKINWKPSPTELRQFGLTMFIAGVLIGSILFWKGKVVAASSIVGAGVLVGLLAILLPSVAIYLYRFWMGIALVMGTITSAILLCVIFFGVITPVSLCMRLFGRDPLRLRPRPGVSHWVEVVSSQDKNAYERLF